MISANKKVDVVAFRALWAPGEGPTGFSLPTPPNASLGNCKPALNRDSIVFFSNFSQCHLNIADFSI